MALGAAAAIVAGALYSISTDRFVMFMGGIIIALGIIFLVLGAVIWFSAGRLSE
jgi:hypothetical protein